jgi:hypothetical protein
MKPSQPAAPPAAPPAQTPARPAAPPAAQAQAQAPAAKGKPAVQDDLTMPLPRGDSYSVPNPADTAIAMPPIGDNGSYSVANPNPPRRKFATDPNWWMPKQNPSAAWTPQSTPTTGALPKALASAAASQAPPTPTASPFRATAPQGGAGSPPAPSTTQPQTGGGVRFAPPQKNEPLRIIPGKKGPNGGMIVMNEKTNKTYEVPYPEGTSDELTAEQKERKAEFATRQGEAGTRQSEVNEARTARLTAAQQALENKAAQDHERAGQKKEAMQGMAQSFYDAAGAQPGETYFPPRYQNGIVVPGPAAVMPADKDQALARQKELKNAAAGFEKTAKTHQNEQERIEKQHGWGRFAPTPAAGQQPPAQTGQRPAPPRPAQPTQGVAAPAPKAAQTTRTPKKADPLGIR